MGVIGRYLTCFAAWQREHQRQKAVKCYDVINVDDGVIIQDDCGKSVSILSYWHPEMDMLEEPKSNTVTKRERAEITNEKDDTVDIKFVDNNDVLVFE